MGWDDTSRRRRRNSSSQRNWERRNGTWARFSNLGAWDSEKKITSPDCIGDWLVAPPVLSFQRFGAGRITFQNRLSLLIQAHPELTTDAAVCRTWIRDWVKAIEAALAQSDADRVSAAVTA